MIYTQYDRPADRSTDIGNCLGIMAVGSHNTKAIPTLEPQFLLPVSTTFVYCFGSNMYQNIQKKKRLQWFLYTVIILTLEFI